MLHPMLIDSHCHLDFPDFADDREAVIARAKARGIGRLITISTRGERFAEISAIAARDPDIFCPIGTPPHQAPEEAETRVAQLASLARHRKCVGIGEAGLD